jgi:hypothetical protein
VGGYLVHAWGNVLHVGFRSWYVQLLRWYVWQERVAVTFKGTRPFFTELVLSKIKATGPFATSGTTYPPTQMTSQKTGDPRVTVQFNVSGIFTLVCSWSWLFPRRGHYADRCLTIFIFKLVTAVGIDLGTQYADTRPKIHRHGSKSLEDGNTAGMFMKYGSENEQFVQLPVIGAKQGTGSLSCAS